MRPTTHSTFASKSILAVQMGALLCALATFAFTAPQSKPRCGFAARTDSRLPHPKKRRTRLSRRQRTMTCPLSCRFLDRMARISFLPRTPFGTRTPPAHLPRKAHEKMEVVIDPKNPKRAILTVGNEDWPSPIPIVNRGGKWQFDTKAGLKEDPVPADRDQRTRRHHRLPWL